MCRTQDSAPSAILITSSVEPGGVQSGEQRRGREGSAPFGLAVGEEEEEEEARHVLIAARRR